MADPLFLCPSRPCSTGSICWYTYPLFPFPEPLPCQSGSLPSPILSITELAEFTSTMIYLLWHARRPCVLALDETASTSKCVLDEDDRRETALIANATSTTFKTFCNQVLTATQVSESVVLLSLKYIARLLHLCPSIQGAQGSEFRLFIVSLILASKFLDDHTLTSKTWSAVSGMRVGDLSVMEFEFLTVLEFRLFVPKHEFDYWKWELLMFREQLVCTYRPGIAVNTTYKYAELLWQTPEQAPSFQCQYLPLTWNATQSLSRSVSRMPAYDLTQPRATVGARACPSLSYSQDLTAPDEYQPITPADWARPYAPGTEASTDEFWACCLTPTHQGI